MFKLLLSFFILSSAHAVMVISDVDDTIKITNSASTVGAAWSGLFHKDVFAGMPETYRAWGEKNYQIHFVTGSPTLVSGKIKELLNYHKIPFASLTTRKNMFENTYAYKMRKITALMEKYPDEQVLFVGDDVTADHTVFAALSEKYPGRVLDSYVRPVRNRAGLEGQVGYVTAYDIATQEVMAGRLGFLALGKVMAAVLTGPKDKLLPKFTYCPTELDGTLFPTENSHYLGAEQVENHVESICRGRQSDSEKLP